jgi:hypothetical protein
MSDKYYVVTAISQYRMKYVIPVDDIKDETGEVKPEWAADSVVMGEVEEFSQLHLGETVIDVHEVDEQTVLETFDKENEYAASWSTEKKLERIKNWRYRG